ncbi:MAG: hypothetical protein V2I97_13575, partial [Desulfococcaceae bacterium]|nr:hypothetical protein [Desulfococcaceae bacterium]
AGIFLFLSSLNAAAQDGGYDVFSGLWLKTVLRTSAGDFTLVWKEVGRDMTPGGDKVISGYFYADPDEFAYGSEYNPEIFVKIYAASNGWANIAFNHVTVDNADVYSAHNYSGTAQQSGTVTLNSRLAEHSYTGVSADADFTPPVSGSEASVYQDGGYLLFSDLWAKSVLRTAADSVTLKWKVVGNDTTPSGDKVISGYFYADPDDFAFGSEYNPEMFVKVYVAANGWANIAFNHVTVDPVDVYSAHSYKGRPDSTGSAALGSRLVEHSYTGVPLQPVISYTGHWKSKESVYGTGGPYFGATDEFYIDIQIEDNGSFSGFGGMYIGIMPITCIFGICTWHCGWIDSSDNRVPVSGYINGETDTGVIRMQGFSGEKSFTVREDENKPGKFILDLEDDGWSIKKFVIYKDGGEEEDESGTDV